MKQEDLEFMASLWNVRFYKELGMLLRGRVLANHAQGPWFKPQYYKRVSLDIRSTEANTTVQSLSCRFWLETVHGSQ